MEQLLFQNPQFHDGLNVSVRLGHKWYEKFSGMQKEDSETPAPLPVSIVKTGTTEEICKGVIEDVQYVPFVTIPHEVLLLEHDGSCTNLGNLYREMKKVYDESFTAGSYVSVVFFHIMQ